MKTIDNIRSFPIFSEFPALELKDLLLKLEYMNVRKNSYILRENSNDSNLYFILSGSVKIFRSNKLGKELVLAEFLEGSYFGEISLLTGNTRTANVLAISKCELAKLSKSDFFSHINKHKTLMSIMLKELAQRLMLTTAHISDFAFLDLTTHLLKLISSLSVKVELDGQEVALVRESPAHQELAARLNVTREAVTRALGKLEKEGLITRVDKQIIVRA